MELSNSISNLNWICFKCNALEGHKTSPATNSHLTKKVRPVKKYSEFAIIPDRKILFGVMIAVKELKIRLRIYCKTNIFLIQINTLQYVIRAIRILNFLLGLPNLIIIVLHLIIPNQLQAN